MARPDDKTIWIQRGLVYQDLGNHSLAIEDFEKAIGISNNSCSMAMFHMATSKLKDGQIDSAIEDFKHSEQVIFQ